MEDEENKGCFLRLYIGASSYQIGTQFPLRNFPLSLDKMESLSLDVGQYAEAVAERLAILHWGAGIDARDMEFVLGGSRAEEERERSSVWVWVLDFNQCGGIEMDERGVEMAAMAFWDNDLYFPCPNMMEEKDMQLWEFFRERYFEISERIVNGEDKEVNDLRRSFLRGWQRSGRGGRRAGFPMLHDHTTEGTAEM